MLALLVLPFSQFNSSAQGTRGRDLTRQEGSGAKGSSPQVAPLAIPNDTCATAIPLTLRQSVDGTLSTAVDDYRLSGAACFIGLGQTASIADGGDAVYSFTAPVTGNYSFKLTDFTGVGDLVLYTASSCPVGAPPQTVATCLMAANRNAVQASEEVLCQAMTSGQTVFIFVDKPAASTTTTFKIEVTQCQQETEANDTPATANPFVFGVEGTITPGTDLDYYSLGVTAPGQRVFAMVDGSAGNGSDFDMRVTTTTDTLEYDDDNNFFPFGNLAPNVGGTPVVGTNTYIQVSSFGSAVRQPYRLYAVVEPPSALAVPETEGNDTIATANTSPLGYFSGTIATATDTDFYSFNARAGDIIFVGYDGDPTRDTTTVDGILNLLDSSSNVLITVNDAEFTSDQTPSPGTLLGTTPNSNAEALVYRIQTTGTYYVQVNSDFGDTGDYLLAISRNGFAATGPTAAGTTLSGQVTTNNGSPLAGVAVYLSGSKPARTITDGDGRYSFTGLEAGEFFTVTPAIANYTFSPRERSFSLLSDRTDAVFTATPNAIITSNPLDTDLFFVRQQYLDFLGREPDAGGLAYWSDQLAACGANADCIRQRSIDVSAAYFMSDEFQATGSYVYRLYEAGLGRRLSYAEFNADRSQVLDGANLDARKAAFASSFVNRPEFIQKYAGAMTAAAFVDALVQSIRQSSDVDLSNARSALIARYNAGGSINESRSLALQEAIENASFRQAEYNPSFVLMEYYGYLRRDVDEGGYRFWLDVLNNRVAGNYRSMVCAFMTSSEYQRRFSPVATRSNAECGQ
ncbi:MAG TPA: DUF4214 domain-containing protein [Pyrinomonadaceae bacterium]|nr:DUF4214 domain-containing protein [Pyrinomonadaceae bacterium]